MKKLGNWLLDRAFYIAMFCFGIALTLLQLEELLIK